MEEMQMLRRIIISCITSLAIALPSALSAQSQFGTAPEAKAMLEKAVAAVKADKGKALDMFNKGEGGFKDRDLQPFCFNISDGKIVATTVPSVLGADIRTLKDKNGKAFGLEGFQGAKEGSITETSPYMFPRPGTDPTPHEKVSFVTRVADLGCGVATSNSKSLLPSSLSIAVV
jgi:Single Cache domain 2